MSAGEHAQSSPVETNLHTTCRGIVAFMPLEKNSKISQQTASVLPKNIILSTTDSTNFPMNAIQTDENIFLNSQIAFEKVGPTISKCFPSTHTCAWRDIVP